MISRELLIPSIGVIDLSVKLWILLLNKTSRLSFGLLSLNTSIDVFYGKNSFVVIISFSNFLTYCNLHLSAPELPIVGFRLQGKSVHKIPCLMSFLLICKFYICVMLVIWPLITRLAPKRGVRLQIYDRKLFGVKSPF